ncbi:MAG: PQQ-dependent sugar dehydrogenase [Proteobacteria bacterium]|nr:PQQ-dependent sugar dehydrogenase [Pseudomonadota bacterium]
MGGLVFSLALHQGTLYAQSRVFKSDKHKFVVTEMVKGLEHPWGMAFMPDGDILVTERGGHLRIISKGELLDQAIGGLPEIEEVGQGGLLGIALHPDFASNQRVYLSYAGLQNGRASTEVLRGRLQGMSLHNVETIFRALPKTKGGRHFGSRLLFAPDKTLYISLGDRGFKPSLCQKHPSQQLENHLGSLIRIRDDGSIPSDNPFAGHQDVKPEIYTYGNRNMQGMALHPDTQQIWTHEHGPQGGDEINIMQPGINYGWPVITYGVNYGIGTKICEGTHKQGMQQPNYKWVPSIAPSGMAFYTGDDLPAWKGNLFVGSLKFGLLVRLELRGNEIIGEERLLNDEYGRIRDVVQGPDGYLYLLTDSSIGSLLRISSEK